MRLTYPCCEHCDKGHQPHIQAHSIPCLPCGQPWGGTLRCGAERSPGVTCSLPAGHQPGHRVQPACVEATDANPERVNNGCMIFRAGQR